MDLIKAELIGMIVRNLIILGYPVKYLNALLKIINCSNYNGITEKMVFDLAEKMQEYIHKDIEGE